ncbi:sugar phosphate isomerase/epimerase [Mesorhizobium sp. M2D.F.Ca.ET.185.01.1.1]|uniref:sugar phosphate isomerase/epimerase family protein n=1 Tax=unclassified Mesorhizobium TaxID=325217 RepID=UPI000FCCB969|nr:MULTISPECIES: sugar phosphate isomerase/epimerase [unclassified Mesorhizobium]TGP82061.1 sugar phosphate isomerase/epimerase [bacterium M00.F.Ca.ET.227.01.1.1]TGP92047.1 sugar phosphate isomerase/epimerase [bacterium M00.F.Ca.ET.221.01.1.1]TGP95168.1 sugar phosphate isomerase/epimerase [bacterium M00.F.Ca.ET.222.01.1.1]TGU09727.1 sugar phosphate isomerase/epimerase [bacterium M00.F.Ca.ET.163.01.1.1]TGU38911.1 sugar phosphate isomerase/epimerase [bacterium M00.F.Ca.ET.156.01.1.1]TGU47751.1 
MKIGMITDSLGNLSFDEMLRASAELGLETLEFACGNWSSAPHIDLAAMLESAATRGEFVAKVRDHGLTIAALNCSGNPLHPGPQGKQHRQVTEDTIRLASLMGIDRVVMMSGLPGGPGDANPNWIITDWPPECADIQRYQWDECIIPYWRDLVAFANNLGIGKLCLELHGHQAVYNVQTLFRLREAVGETVGANYDPSHPMWMGADPIAAVRKLGSAIYYVHAKDTRVEPIPAGIDGVLDARPPNHYAERAWNYITLGYGHGETWWRQFCTALKQADYDDVLSIEHEDMMLSPMEGMRKSVALLRNVAINLA